MLLLLFFGFFVVVFLNLAVDYRFSWGIKAVLTQDLQTFICVTKLKTMVSVDYTLNHYDWALNSCVVTSRKISCYCIFLTDPFGLLFEHVHWCFIWFLTFVLKFCCKSHRTETLFEEVQDGGFFCLCFDRTYYIVFLPSFGDSLFKLHFSSL